MASISNPKPGSAFGPCLDDACGHPGCEAMRDEAKTPCAYCEEPIGYERAFVTFSDEDTGYPKLAHFSCTMREVEGRG